MWNKTWLLYGASDATYEKLRPIMYDISSAMCPPWPDNDTVSSAVDQLAVRYKSLARPHPYLWYGALGVLVLLIPWARRRYLFPVLLAGAILANHAAISAVVLNVQPRYIAVTNPYKGFLLLMLFYIVGLFLRCAWSERNGWLASPVYLRFCLCVSAEPARLLLTVGRINPAQACCAACLTVTPIWLCCRLRRTFSNWRTIGWITGFAARRRRCVRSRKPNRRTRSWSSITTAWPIPPPTRV